MKSVVCTILLFAACQVDLRAQETIFPDLSGEELLEAIDAEYSPITWFSYDRARDTLFLRVDSDNGELRGVYTGFTITLSAGEDPTTDAFNQGINTEHTFPQSMGADEEPARSDMHHLFPVKDNVNSSRSNHPYDEIPDEETDTWFTTDQSSTTIPSAQIGQWSEKDNDNPNPGFEGRFEPREDHKGDAARAVFYFQAIYPERADAGFFKVQKDVLHAWHNFDPPDDAERARSEKIAAYQGTRNPFVHDTTLVRRAFFEGSAGSFHSVAYTFSGNAECPTTDDGPTQPFEEATFTEVMRSGVGCNDGVGVFNSRDWPSTRSGDHYVEFSGNAPLHASLSFIEGSTLSFMARRSGTGPPNGEVMYQVDGGDFTTLDTWELTGTDDQEFSLSLADVGEVRQAYFRFFGWGSTSGQGTLRFDDVQVSFGIVATRTDDMVELPLRSLLLGIYPNPFSTSANVAIEVDRPQRVRIELLDLLGRRVRVVAEAYFGSGPQTIQIKGEGLPSGMYFLRVGGDGAVSSRPVVLMR